MRAPRNATPYTGHARARAAQRGVKPAAVLAAISWGREVARPGVLECRLDRRSVLEARRHGVDVAGHEGTIVVLSAADGRVITVYRNRTPRRVWR